jgi:hypothetical protein
MRIKVLPVSTSVQAVAACTMGKSLIGSYLGWKGVTWHAFSVCAMIDNQPQCMQYLHENLVQGDLW